MNKQPKDKTKTLNHQQQQPQQQQDEQDNTQNTNLSKTKGVAQFKMGDQLGEGSFGVVRSATHILTGERVAVKILERSRIKEQKDKIRIQREINIMKSLNHLNTIRLYSIIETNTTQYLIQEYASGKELSEYIYSKTKLDDKEACRYFQQIISGVEYIHKLQIAHRDLKPENMLLTASKDIKIVDFGLSNTYKKGELLATACGSPCYAAPEMLSGKKYRGITVDIWSCGVILYVMLVGGLPFEDTNNEALYKKIIAGKYTIPDTVSKGGKDLIKKILETNPKKRITLPEIKKHKWFNIVDPETNVHCGIDPKKDVIPIDEGIVGDMEGMGYKKEEVRMNVLINEHNNITTTYYLLLKKKMRSKIPSVSDLKSMEYDQYMKDENNKLDKYDNSIERVIKERASSKGVLDVIPGESDDKEHVDNEKEINESKPTPVLAATTTTAVVKENEVEKKQTQNDNNNNKPTTCIGITTTKKKSSSPPKRNAALPDKHSMTTAKSVREINRNKLSMSTGFTKDKPKLSISNYVSSKLKSIKQQPTQKEKTLTKRASSTHEIKPSIPLRGYNSSGKITSSKRTHLHTTTSKHHKAPSSIKETQIKKSLEKQLISPIKDSSSTEKKFKDNEDIIIHSSNSKSRDRPFKAAKNQLQNSKTVMNNPIKPFKDIIPAGSPRIDELQHPNKKIEAKICVSPFDMGCVYYIEPHDMKKKIIKILTSMKIKTKLEKQNNLKIICENQTLDMKFECDFLQLPQQPGICVLKFKKIEGNYIHFKLLVKSIQHKLI